MADVPDGPDLVAERLGATVVAAASGIAPAVVPLGLVDQVDGRCAVTVLPPLARLDLAMLDALVALGHDDVRALDAPHAELRRRAGRRRGPVDR